MLERNSGSGTSSLKFQNNSDSKKENRLIQHYHKSWQNNSMVENDLSPVANTNKKNKTLKNNSNFGIMYSERNCNSDPKLAMNIVKSTISDGFLNNA